MLRHIAPYVNLQNVTDTWPDLLSQAVLNDCQIMQDEESDLVTINQLLAQTALSPLDELAPIAPWFVDLAALIRVPPDKLQQCHLSLLDVVIKRLAKNKT